VSDLIHKVEFFSIKDNKVVQYTVSDEENSQYLKAAKANFGLFGMMFAITIEVEPLEKIEVKNSYEKTNDFLENAKDLKN